jgi:putative transposase
VTPNERHRGEDQAILGRRKALYEAARTAHPERWSPNIRHCDRIESVSLNLGKSSSREVSKQIQNAA